MNCKECHKPPPIVCGIQSCLADSGVCISCAMKPSQECIDEFTKFAAFACKWCGNATDRKSRKCDDCLRDIDNDRKIDEARGK